jgi:hypothetical protein
MVRRNMEVVCLYRGEVRDEIARDLVEERISRGVRNAKS